MDLVTNLLGTVAMPALILLLGMIALYMIMHRVLSPRTSFDAHDTFRIEWPVVPPENQP
jgi:hypothetical protein